MRARYDDEPLGVVGPLPLTTPATGIVAPAPEAGPSGSSGPSGTAVVRSTARPSTARPRTQPARRGPLWWRWLRRAFEAAVIGGGVYALYEARNQVGQAAGLLTHVDWTWLLGACVVELGSMVAFARLQRWLLRAGGVELGLGPMVEITLAGNALAISLPGGVAWSATFAFEQLRRRRADRTLAIWVLLVAGALQFFALFVLIVIGVWGAGSSGPARDLRLPAIGLAGIPLAVAAAFLAVRHSRWCRRAGAALAGAMERRLPAGATLARWARSTVVRLKAVQPRGRDWAASFGLALLSWVYDCACLVFAMKALGIAIPWRGLLVAYCLGQIGNSLPITPGGIGIVEGSMSVALIAYGLHTTDAVAAVLLYRIISFWALVPIGWGAWGYLQLLAHRADGGGRPHPWAWQHRGIHDETAPSA